MSILSRFQNAWIAHATRDPFALSNLISGKFRTRSDTIVPQ
jgi:hypothetical protein